MLTLSLSSINRRLRSPLYRLLVLSLVCGMVLSANSQAFMAWQMALSASADAKTEALTAESEMNSLSACHTMMNTKGVADDKRQPVADHRHSGNTPDGKTPEADMMADCDVSCPCCAGACSSFAMTLDMPRAIRSKQQGSSRYTPRPAAAVVLALPQRPPIFS